MTRPTNEALLVTGAVAGAALALVALGQGPLGGPADWSAHGVASWAAECDPVTVAMAVLRLATLGATVGVLLAGLAAMAGAALHVPALAHAADLITLPGAGGLVRRMAGLGLSASTLLGSGAGATTASPPPVVATQLRTPSPAPPPVATRLHDVAGQDPSAPPAPTTATMVRVDGTDPHDSGQATMAVVDEPAQPIEPSPSPEPRQPAEPSPPPAPTSWTVKPGDHLWSIAESTLAWTGAEAPTEAQVDRYWRAVVRANAHLADPDLIFPGQQIQLPPVPSPRR